MILQRLADGADLSAEPLPGQPIVEIAKDTYERHQFFQGFLTGLGINPEIAAHDACEMEHSVSPETFSAMKAMLERVKGTTTKE